jgi:glucosamine-6-phosphate deaminase
MKVNIKENPAALGAAAGSEAASLIREAIRIKGSANIILATGTSQFETISQLIAGQDIDWGKVTMFHLDEYIGMSDTHPASFRKYLKERFLDRIPPLKAAYLIDGEADAQQECSRLDQLINAYPIDVAMVGIGENGHLAFNDPPADFETDKPYLVANLDELCRAQQMNEGWFATLADVPGQAISMSIKQIMRSAHIICSVPDLRKAAAVRDTLENEVSNIYPASILKNHPSCSFFLDKQSASLLSGVSAA